MRATVGKASAMFAPLSLARGPCWKNRLALAPMTNQQSHPDGTLSDEEFRWLTMRAEGGFSLTMTCAAHVQENGQGFPGQLGVFDDRHIAGLSRLATAIRARGSVSSVQLHHAGCRSPRDIVAVPVCPSDNEATGARGLTLAEVEQLVEDFVAAAVRCERAGFDGVEIHGAHGYILAQFLSPETNKRDDRYGGSNENRTRIIREIIAGIRTRCRPTFQLGLRISPERFGLVLGDMVKVAQDVLAEGSLDYLDVSLWDVFKEPEDESFRGRSLLSYFTSLERGDTRLGVAGKIRTVADAERALSLGVDFLLVGRAAIIHHDFPTLGTLLIGIHHLLVSLLLPLFSAAADPEFRPLEPPISRAHLAAEGLSPAFIEYMARPFWGGFVKEDPQDSGASSSKL